jgi:hypothetical protein
MVPSDEPPIASELTRRKKKSAEDKKQECDEEMASKHTRIWYKKYWMNCFSSGLEVSNR